MSALQSPDLPDDRLPLFLTPEEAAIALRCSRTSVYALLKGKRLRSVNIGRRRLIPRDAIAEFAAGS